jgi:hypothetical protein
MSRFARFCLGGCSKIPWKWSKLSGKLSKTSIMRFMFRTPLKMAMFVRTTNKNWNVNPDKNGYFNPKNRESKSTSFPKMYNSWGLWGWNSLSRIQNLPLSSLSNHLLPCPTRYGASQKNGVRGFELFGPWTHYMLYQISISKIWW